MINHAVAEFSHKKKKRDFPFPGGFAEFPEDISKIRIKTFAHIFILDLCLTSSVSLQTGMHNKSEIPK